MAGMGSLVLRPWIRELVLGSDALSSPQPGQLLEVLQEAEAEAQAQAQAPGPPRVPDTSDVAAALLVSDGTHSVRCLVTREALNASDWEEKEFGFRGAEGRLLLLQDCGVRVQVGEGGAAAEFYLQVDRFSLLPTEQPLERVIGCNQDPDVQKKLFDCLEEHLSESISPSPGLALSQLLDEVQEDQEHQGALVHLAESCLMLTGPCTAPPLTRWASTRCRATGEAVYTVPSSWLHISENDQRVLSSLGPGSRTQAPELPPPDPALQDLSLTIVSPSSPTSSGTPALPSHVSSEENGASISLLPALSLAASDLVQKGSSQAVPAICSAHGPLPPGSPHSNPVPSSPLLSCTPSLSPLGHVPSPHQAIVTKAQKPSLEFKELGLPLKNWHQSPRTKNATGALESSPVWDPPKRHRDGSAFQYEYEPPCTSLCAQVQAVRLPPQLVAWALHFLMEPQPESELTQV
ncbi:adrenocortical dysplasia protein homolog isoform X3 [Canis lupus dingo]|uniref:adrenocortical dysplasia protein homolog isoform X3 n=1 Tax=Canis lupus dingo TaxID=286419 RepID=UPI000DC698F4|nr:adrenocortical dysplasia protein homolog isoform X3 [Canis lupus dingo]XP_038523254.1 adrenocortical dysplasia protein homolog isoform X2 [Canis lupus familiaris]